MTKIPVSIEENVELDANAPKTNCLGCGKEIIKDSLMELDFCPGCAKAALHWGFGQWVKAGCPGAKRE